MKPTLRIAKDMRKVCAEKSKNAVFSFFAEPHPILGVSKDNTNREKKKQVYLIFYPKVQFILSKHTNLRIMYNRAYENYLL